MSSTRGEPWWASGTEPDRGGQPGAEQTDPVEAHRAARRGLHGDAAGSSHAGGSGTDETAAGDPVDVHDLDVCGVCPICTGLRALGEVRPELVAHLTDAARHLAAAARALFEEAGSPAAAADDPPDEGVTRIDLD